MAHEIYLASVSLTLLFAPLPPQCITLLLVGQGLQADIGGSSLRGSWGNEKEIRPGGGWSQGLA